jgi:hypothetical protein
LTGNRWRKSPKLEPLRYEGLCDQLWAHELGSGTSPVPHGLRRRCG